MNVNGPGPRGNGGRPEVRPDGADPDGAGPTRRRAIGWGGLALGAVLFGAGCGRKVILGDVSTTATETKAELPRDPADPDRAGASAPAVAATAALAVDLYRRLASDAANGNLVFSPYSIEMALAMTRIGAKGETRDQIDRVIRAGRGTELDESFNTLAQTLAGRNGPRGHPGRTGDVSVDVANALWAQQDLAFETAFLSELARDYGAGVNLVDYVHDTEGSRTRINDWVAGVTHDRIRDLIAQGAIGADTRLVVTNAVYFKAPWETPFLEAGAKPFRRLDGSTVDLPAVSGGGGTYGEGAGWRAAELPYLGEELSMVLIVPDDLAAFEATLDGPTLAGITGGLRTNLLSALLPPFSFRKGIELGPALSALGMPLPFDDGADFSAMTTKDHLHIDSVVHQAFIAVDAEGTEAAAATAVVIVGVSAEPEPEGKSLIVDRPFLFAIRDRETNALLFLGRITDPAAT